jgi:hypothetical protein
MLYTRVFRFSQAQYSWLGLGQAQYNYLQVRSGFLAMSLGLVRLSTVGLG